MSATVGLVVAGALALPQSGPPDAPPAPAADAAAAIVQEEPLLRLPPVVVTPTRGEEPLLELPFAISSVDPQELKRTVPANTPDALRDEPGLVMQQSNQGGGSPVLRGRSGKDVLLLIDGQRFSNSTFRRNHQYLNTVDVFALDSMEVVRGPASVLYGSDAMGGAINLLLRHPTPEGLDGFGGRLHGQHESANRSWIGHADASAEISGWGFFAGATWRHFGDLSAGRVGGDPLHAVDQDGKQDPTGYRERAFNFAVSHALTEQDTLDFATLYSRQWNVPASERIIPNEENPNPSDLERDTDPQRLRWHELRYRHDGSGNFVESFQAIASLNAPVEGRRRRIRASAPSLVTVERDEIFAPGLSLQAGLRWAPDHLLTLGGEGYFERIDSESQTLDRSTGIWTDGANGRFPDGAAYDTLGVFAQDEWKLGGGIEWINGIRYSRIAVDLDLKGIMVGPAGPFGKFDEIYDDVTFATGLTKQVTEETAVYTSIARGFRAPNLDDMAVIGDFAAGNRVPNFDVEPEKVYNFEIGANHASADTQGGVALAVARYHDLLTNEYAFSQGGTDFFVVDNADRATIYTGEVWLERVVCPADAAGLEHSLQFQAFANFGRNHSAKEPVSKVPPPEGLIGHRIESAPGSATPRPWYFETFARGALAQRRITDADRLDPRFPDHGTPAWWTLNFRAAVNLRRGLWLTAGLENLFNYRYRVHGSGIDAAGRNFIAGVDLAF